MGERWAGSHKLASVLLRLVQGRRCRQEMFTLTLALDAPYVLVWIEPAADSLQRFLASAALLRDTPSALLVHTLLSRAQASNPRRVAWTARTVFPPVLHENSRVSFAFHFPQIFQL